MGELFQPMHLLVIVIICLILFGPKRLPELGKGLGEGIRALKESMKDQTTNQTANPPANQTPVDPAKGPESKS